MDDCFLAPDFDNILGFSNCCQTDISGNFMSANDLPSMAFAVESPISYALSQFTLLSTTVVTREWHSLYTEGEWVSSQWTKVSQSLVSRTAILAHRSLCWSEVELYTPVKPPSASQMGMLSGTAWTHFIRELSVVPRLWVIPPDIFNKLISSSSVIWSEKLPLHKWSVWRMVKYLLLVNFSYCSTDGFLEKFSICCRYSLADLAYARWPAAWNRGVILRTECRSSSQLPVVLHAGPV